MKQLQLIFTFFFFIGSITTFASKGYAETIKGEIKSVTPEGRSFRLIRQDTRNEVQIGLSVETKFQGLSSLDELEAGDEVIVEAQKNPGQNQWESDSLTVEKVVIKNPRSDVEVMKESSKNSALEASLKDESQTRILNEMDKTLERFDKEIEKLKIPAYRTNLQDLGRAQQTAHLKLETLEKSTFETWEQNRLEAATALQELASALDNSK